MFSRLDVSAISNWAQCDGGSGILIEDKFRLGDWLVDTKRRQLTNLRLTPATPITIEPKTLAVLTYLASRYGDVVSMDDIIENVWGDYPVSDNPVYKCIAKLRKIFENGDKTPKYIETITKTGYRLMVEPRPAEEPVDRVKTNQYSRQLFALLWVLILVGAGLILFLTQNTEDSFKILRQTHVSAFPGSHKNASISPDETEIAFISNMDGIDHVWLLTLSREEKPRQLTFGDLIDSRPRWSPTGEEILFGRDGGIWSVSPNTRLSRRIVADGANPNWSRDGKEFVFERQGEIWIASTDGSRQKKVEGVPTLDLELAQRMPALSPDGSQIVFFRAAVGPLGDFWTIASEGGKPKRITFDNTIGSAPAWSADGKTIVYSSQRTGNKTLWRVDTEGGEPKAILEGPGEADAPVFSPSGDSIIFNHVQQRYVLLLTDLENGNETELLESSLFVGGPSFSHDGSRIAFFKIGKGGFVDIFTIDSEGETLVQITLDENSINAIPQWSSDDQSIFFYQVVPGMSFREVSSKGGYSRLLVEGWDWNLEHGAHVDSDNQKIIYSRLSRGVPVTTRIRQIESGDETVFGRLLDRPRWSSQGDTVIGGKFTNANNPEGDGVVLCKLLSDQCQQLTNSGLKPQWSHDESGIYYVKAYPGGQELWLVDRDDPDTAQQIGVMEPISPIGNFYDVSADKRLVWVRFEQSDSELWKIDFVNQGSTE